MTEKLVDISLYQEEEDSGITIDFIFEGENGKAKMGCITFPLGDSLKQVGTALSVMGKLWIKRKN